VLNARSTFIGPGTMAENARVAVRSNESMFSEAFEGFSSPNSNKACPPAMTICLQVPVPGLETAPKEKDM
jgi:hypothetical protein